MSAGKSLSLTFARVILGVIALTHGLANTFGVFGGPGLENFASEMQGRVSVAPELTTYVVAIGALLTGLLLVLGVLARLAAGVILLLLLAMAFVTARYVAFFVQNDGIEYLLALCALCLVVMTHGPGGACLDLGKLLARRDKKSSAAPAK